MGKSSTDFVGWASKTQKYLEAALILDKVEGEQQRPSEPAVFLYHHSVELALKTYLIACGYTAEDLKKFGHDFGSLLGQSLKHGFQLGELARGFVRDLPKAGGVIDVKYFQAGWASRHVTGYSKNNSIEVVLACIVQAFEKGALKMPDWLEVELSQLQ